MSVTNQTSTERCKDCGEQMNDFYSPGYCSHECYYRKRGEDAMDVVRDDHRICATCLRYLKDIERPPEDWKEERGSSLRVAMNRGAEYHSVDEQTIALDVSELNKIPVTAVDSVIGFEYGTENAEGVVKEIEVDEHTRVCTHGVGCICGNTDPSETFEYAREVEPKQLLVNFITTFRRLEAEGHIDRRIDKDVFFDAFRDSRDWEYALGRALYD